MKKRNGFISNSSSSSFIVAFPSIPENYNKLDKEILKHWSPRVTKQVWNDVVGQLSGEAFSEKDFINCLSGLYYFETHDELEKEHPEWKEDLSKLWDLIAIRTKEKATIRWKEFKEENKNSVFYIFEYEDGTGAFFSYMEHGGIFNHLPNIHISHH